MFRLLIQRLLLPTCMLLLVDFRAMCQKPAGRGAVRVEGTRNVVEELRVRVEAQAKAVAAGDPATIASTSADLDAQIYSLLAQFELSRGQSRKATELYRRSLDLRPSKAGRLEFAEALLKSGDAGAALAEADEVLAASPDEVAALAIRGNALREAGRGKEAAATLTRALTLRSDPGVAFALGSTYLALHEKEKAAAIFERLLEASGRSAIWYVAIGDAYRDAGYMEDALRSLNAGVSRDPGVLHGEFFLGLTYLQMNQWGPSSESFQHLRKAVLLSPQEYVSNFFLGALESTDGSDLVASDAHLLTASVADPTQPEVWLYLGLNANRERRFAEAKRYLQRSIELTGKDEARNNYQVRRAYFSLGRLLIADGDRAGGEAMLARYKAAEQAAVRESGRTIAATAGDRAETSLSALATAAPAASEQVPGEAGGAAIAGRDGLTTAEDKLRTLLANSLNDLGTAHARQHEYAAALKDFAEAETWAPANPLILRNLGAAAFRQKDSAEVVRALGAYRKRQTDAGEAIDTRAQMMLALAEFDLGRFADAASSFALVESAVLADPAAGYSYGFALSHSGHAQEANRVADALAARQLPKELLPLVCHLYIETENYKGSKDCYERAVQLDPALPMAHYEIGESLIRLDRPAEAIPALREELRLGAGNASVSTALAFALLQTGQKREARELLEATTAQHPEYAEAQYEYGKLLLEMGDPVRSIEHLEVSEQADGSKDYVHYQLGTAYKKAGRTPDAEREFEKYREIKQRNRNGNAVPGGR